MARTFSILATSDVHGYVMAHTYSDNKEGNLGLAKISSLFHMLKDENTICIDNGDCLTGSPLSFYFNMQHSQEAHLMSQVFKHMQYDYMNLGNHDFNLGPDVLAQHIKDCGIPCLCANVTLYKTPLCDRYIIHTFPNGIRIALFGVVTQHIVHWEKPENLIGIEIEDAYDCAVRLVQEIRINEQVDAIVGVYHGGFERDLTTGVPTENLNGENKGYEMCKNIDGLDILITGHQHRSIATTCCKTIVTQTAYNGQEIAKITFDIDNKTGQATLISTQALMDPKIIQLIKPWEDACQQWLDQPLGHASYDLLVHDQFQARLHKHPIVSFINQVQLSQCPADFSAVALFNDAKGFHSDVTMRDVVSTYVYSNTLSKLTLNGHTLKAFLEKCAEYFEIVDDNIVVSARFVTPKPAHFNYDMVDGLDYTIKVSNPIGQRITSMTKNGKPLDLNATYTLVVSNYRASGGGDFDMMQEVYERSDDAKDMVDCIADYILSKPNIQIDHKENITILK